MPKYNNLRNLTPLSVSQNFLTSSAVIRGAIRAAGLGKADVIIEIGAGKGHITREISLRCAEVRAIEYDPRLYNELKVKFANTSNIKIYHGDILSWRMPEQGDYKVFSNIPFSITSDIIKKLTRCPNPPREAWLIMEKGAAKRFIGLPNESAASLMLKPFYDTGIAYYFRREDFHPSPGVDIVLAHFIKKAEPDIPYAYRNQYERFVKNCKRYGIHSVMSKKQVHTAFRGQGFGDIKPSGEMLYVQWLCLFRRYAGLNRD